MWGDGYGSSNEKMVTVYLNGDFMAKPVRTKLTRKMKDLRKAVCDQFNFHGSREFRLFTEKGIEIFEDDLEYIEDDTSLYASKGADFDTNSCLAEYDLVKELGEGGFGKVMLGVHKKTKEKVAIKQLHTQNISNAGEMDQIFREAEVMETLEHQNIVKIKSCLTIRNQVVFIMEYMEGGELLDRVEKAGKFTEEESQGYFRQIVSAMEYCHRNKLIHRDLKLENILCNSTQDKIVKVADFGISGVASNISVDNIDAGSLRYMAPEVLSGKLKVPSTAVDIWAMGVILYSMLVGDLPFNGKDNKEIMETIIEGHFTIPNNVKKNLSADVINVIQRCLDTDHTKRIRIGQLAAHNWIKDKTMENFLKKQQGKLDDEEEQDNENEDKDQINELTTIKEEEEKKNDDNNNVNNNNNGTGKVGANKNINLKLNKNVSISGNGVQSAGKKSSPNIYQKANTPSCRKTSAQTPIQSSPGSQPRYLQQTKSSTFSNKVKQASTSGTSSVKSNNTPKTSTVTGKKN